MQTTIDPPRTSVNKKLFPESTRDQIFLSTARLPGDKLLPLEHDLITEIFIFPQKFVSELYP